MVGSDDEGSALPATPKPRSDEGGTMSVGSHDEWSGHDERSEEVDGGSGARGARGVRRSTMASSPATFDVPTTTVSPRRTGNPVAKTSCWPEPEAVHVVSTRRTLTNSLASDVGPEDRLRR
jgi:hypothetical protein